MIWKTILLTLLAFVIGVLAEDQVTDAQRGEVKNVINHLCKRNGTEDIAAVYEDSFVDDTRLFQTANKINECIKGLFNIDTIKQEIEEAKPKGALDEVFKKYCAKAPELKTCFHTFLTDITLCLGPTTHELINTYINRSDQQIAFWCHKDGEKMALFIAEGGLECFQEKADEIQRCRERTYAGFTSIDDIIKFSQNCSKFDEYSACFVKALKGCNPPTPGNMFESLFRFQRQSLPCKE